MASKIRLTAEDLWRMPEKEVRQELVNGEVIEMPLVGGLHGMVTALVSHSLYGHVEKHGGGKVAAGDVGFVLNLSYDPERVRGADVAFISVERLPEGKVPVKFFRGAPDLAVEVLSPSGSSAQLQQKIRDYLEAGARLVWVIAPEAKTATIYRADGTARFLTEQDSLEGEAVLPGLTIPLAKLFR